MMVPYQNQAPPQLVPQQQQPYMMSQQYSASQLQPNTSASAEEEEEEEEFRRLWIGYDLQHWMDKVEEENTLWIGDLQHWMDEAYIHRCFAHTGEVFTIKVIRNKNLGCLLQAFTSKVIRNNQKTTTECYGFIEFKSHAIAARILRKFNGTPMPRVAGSSFSLNWASSSSFGSGGEQQRQEEEEEEEDDCAADDLTISVVGDDTDLAAASSDIVTPDFMLPKKDVDCVARYYFDLSSCWKDMLIWWRIARGTHTLEEVRAAHRVYMIGTIFQFRYLVPSKPVIEVSLDELPRYVDFIDITKELHSMDALNPIFGKLYNKDAGIRAKAAKLINTMAKKNHSCWELVNVASRLGIIYNTYIDEHDPTVQSIALDAISSLFSNDKPGISAFGPEGYADLINYVFEIDCVNRQRKALNLIARLVEEHNSDYNIVIELEYPSIMMRLATSVDAGLRKAAFRCLIVLASIEKGENSGQVVKNDYNLKQILQEWIEGIDAIAPEDLAAESDERHLLELLWNACHDEPSSL